MESSDEMHDIVIVGGGICGLATALALHRKGIKSVVLEKSETLRTTGAAIGTLPNGWRALDQLGVADHLRATSLPIQGVRVKFLKEGRDQYFSTKNVGEVRYLKRRTLVETFADALPLKTIRFGCEIVSLELDPLTSFPSLLLSNGNRINAKILIGCDGSRSIVASYLGIKPTKTFRISSIRGLTTYPNGHPYPHEFVRLLSGKTALGRIAITDKLVYWYVGVERGKDAKFTQDPEVIKQIALEATSEGYEADVKDMIERCETETLSLSRMKYYPPWELMFSTFSRGTVAVAGDAMHVMGPFLGQGGSSAMEDAVVLARNLAKAINGSRLDHEKALAQFVKERKMRVLKLATQSYLTVALAEDRSTLSKFVLKTIMALLFRNQGAHVQYDCGQL